MNIKETSKSLREKMVKKSDEPEKNKKNRMKQVLSKRDQAVKAIEKHQDKTGVPNDNEVDEHFYSDFEINKEDKK